MNLFDFYRTAVVRWKGLEQADWCLHADLEGQLVSHVIPAFQADCMDHPPLDYSNDLRKLAYGLHYAPKHAAIWREYLRKNPKSSLHSTTRINSIGTGPGSEVVGLLAGASGLGGKIQLVCMDREVSWRPLLEIVLEQAADTFGMNIEVLLTNSPQDLMAGATVVGSCVLSELGREGRISSFRQVMKAQVGAVRARFLDFPRYPTQNGTVFIEDHFPGCQCVKLYEMGWDLQHTINQEMASASPCWCRVPLTKEPGMRMHNFRF